MLSVICFTPPHSTGPAPTAEKIPRGNTGLIKLVVLKLFGFFPPRGINLLHWLHDACDTSVSQILKKLHTDDMCSVAAADTLLHHC